MPLFYFDIETEGDDPQQDRVVTVQFQPLTDMLEPLGGMSVLAEWDWGEKEILRSILKKGLFEETWDFVPVGNRLRFDLTFLMERAIHHGLRAWSPGDMRRYWYVKPMLDIGPLLVLMNGGKFEGSSISEFVTKPSGAGIPGLYRQGLFQEILDYVEAERMATVALLQEARSLLHTFGDRKRAARQKPSLDGL